MYWECSSAYVRPNLLLGCQPSMSGCKQNPGCIHASVHAQAEEGRQAAVSSFQACIVSALQAGEVATAVAAAEQVVACLGNANGQKAADALLMAQSCRSVLDMEEVYHAAADPQARMCLIACHHVSHHAAWSVLSSDHTADTFKAVCRLKSVKKVAFVTCYIKAPNAQTHPCLLPSANYAAGLAAFFTCSAVHGNAVLHRILLLSTLLLTSFVS